MEEDSNLKEPKTLSARYFFWLLLFTVFSSSGQTTNVLNLCSEEALRAVLGIGGIYRIDCGSNVISSISITEPLVVQRDISLLSTQEVVINGQALTRLFIVKPGVRLTLQKISLFSGRHTETNFNDGGIPDTAGAAIYNDHGIVTILDGRFETNVVVGVTGLAATDGTGEAGEPGGDAPGGAIYNNGGQLFISNTVFVANNATAGAGGKGATGNGGFGGNGGDGGIGGSAAGAAIYSKGGSVAIHASTFTMNTTVGAAAGAGGAASGFLGFPGLPGEAGDGVGAAVSGDSAEITIYGCTFVGNSAKAANALPGNPGLRNQEGEKGLNGGDAAGGAVYSTGRLSVTNSTFFGNTAISGTGGAGGAGGASGFGGNGGNGGSGGSATGGAIESVSGAVIVNCTFSDNVVTAGAGGAAGAAGGLGEAGKTGDRGLATGGAIFGRSAEVILANNILANSRITAAGNISDRGGNLSTDFNVLLTSAASLRLTNPFFRPLANNGGPTQTMALLTNSPALNRGIAEFCPALDQRWSNRVDRCDIGAFELVFAQTNQPLPDVPTNALNGLTFSRTSTNLVTLSWPAGYTNLFLQFATNLLSTNTAWSALQPTTTNGGSNVLNISTIASNRPRAFFRLAALTNLQTSLISTEVTSTNTGPPGPPSP